MQRLTNPLDSSALILPSRLDFCSATMRNGRGRGLVFGVILLWFQWHGASLVAKALENIF